MADIIFPGEEPQENIGLSKLPGNADFSMWQGDSQDFTVKLNDSLGAPIPLTGFTAQATMRASFNAPTSYDFDCTIQNGNEVRIYMSSADSELVPAGDYIWNFQITNTAGDVRTYLAGDVKVYAQVD